MLDIAKVLWECQRERHIFIFRDCSESRMYKRFLKKWDENYFEEDMLTMFDIMLYNPVSYIVFFNIVKHRLHAWFEELLEQEQSEAWSPSARTSWLSLEDITLLRGRQGDCWGEGRA